VGIAVVVVVVVGTVVESNFGISPDVKFIGFGEVLLTASGFMIPDVDVDVDVLVSHGNPTLSMFGADVNRSSFTLFV